MKKKSTLLWIMGLLINLGGISQVPQLIHDIAPTGEDAYISYFTPAGERLYFNGYDGESTKLFSSDGIGEDLIPLMTVDYFANDFVQLGDQVFFRSGNPATGMELYETNNTESGTHLFMEISEGEEDGTGRILGVHNGLLFFVGNDGIHGNELWISDGTISGTTMVKDINTNGDALSFNAGKHYWFNGKVYFEGNDGIHGYETWSSDGTAQGTNLLSDTNPSGDSYLGEAVVKDSEMYFTTSVPGTGSFLWKTNGSDAGTQMIKQIGATSTFGKKLTIYNDHVYFEVGSYSENQGDIWLSDGTTDGTVLWKENASIAAVLNDEFYYMGVSPNSNYAIYKTSGGVGDEQLLIETHPAAAWTYPSKVYEVWNDKLYFFVRYEDQAALYVWSYLFMTDGTPEGSEMQMTESGDSGMLVRTGEGLTLFQDKLYFIGNYSDVGEELFAYTPLAGGVATEHSNIGITLYPNPTHETLNIVCNERLSGNLQIFNAQGQSLRTIKTNDRNQLSIGVEDLPAGMYYLHTQTVKGNPISASFHVR